MARGGYRPGSGPPKGTKYRPRVVSTDKPKVVKKVKGNPAVPVKKKSVVAGKKAVAEVIAPVQIIKGVPDDIAKEAKAENLDPLTYMLRVMNDPSADVARRDRMSVSASPFCHARKGEGAGKRQTKDDNAKAASSGRFAPSMPPVLKAVK